MCRQRCTSADWRNDRKIHDVSRFVGKLAHFWANRLVTRWARWESRFESNPENYCALVHVTCVQVSLIHADVNSNYWGYLFFFFFRNSRRICENSCEIAFERFPSVRDTCMFLWDLFEYQVDAHFEWPTL